MTGWLFAQRPGESLNSDAPKETRKADLKQLLPLSEWRIRRPSRWNVQSNSSRTGDSLGATIGRSLPAEIQVLLESSVSGVDWQSIESADGIVNLRNLSKSAAFQTTFAVADLVSPTETDAALMANADDGIRVWVNGELATTKSEHEELKFHYRFVRVHLKQGTNRIVAKLAPERILLTTTSPKSQISSGYAHFICSKPAVG
jgi:hypothetical protein